ncbi:hypothetical protein, partial [Burkholderia cenocepacia]|uniref:hypothetical protein n=1 Tax=Burkholderia cenocepacia TaxID=95486 RepID=UPI002651CA21
DAAYHLAASSQSVRHSVRRAIHRRHQLRSFNRPQHTKFLTRPFGARMDDDGHPTVTSMTVTTNIDSTVIKDVMAYTTRASAYATFLQTSQALGIPTRVDDYFTSWDPDRGPVVLLGASYITLYQR